jgi:hypothetical protein
MSGSGMKITLEQFRQFNDIVDCNFSEYAAKITQSEVEENLTIEAYETVMFFKGSLLQRYKDLSIELNHKQQLKLDYQATLLIMNNESNEIADYLVSQDLT